MPANRVPSDLAPIPTIAPPTFWDLYHWLAVRDSALKGTIEGVVAAQDMVRLWGPQRLGMAAHPSLSALCALVEDRWGPRPPPERWLPRAGEAWVGLDAKTCLDLRDLLCQKLELRPSEADRMPLSDVADHFCSHGLPAVPSPDLAETAGNTVQEFGGTVQDDHSAAPKRGRGKRIDERMLAEIRDNPESIGWSVQEWADRFKCSKSTVAGTKTWNETIRILRIKAKSDRKGRRSDGT